MGRVYSGREKLLSLGVPVWKPFNDCAKVDKPSVSVMQCLSC